jgi:hypothetical protein
MIALDKIKPGPELDKKNNKKGFRYNFTLRNKTFG